MKYTILPMLLLLVVGCSKETNFTDNSRERINNLNKEFTGGHVNFSQDQLIIKYMPGTSTVEKEQARLDFGVANFKRCQCADEDLELWNFDPQSIPGGDIEGVKETADADERIEGSDINSMFALDDGNLASGVLTNYPRGIQNYVVSEDADVTIAILDTGVEYDYEGFTQPYLHSSEATECGLTAGNLSSGWNFVANNANVSDDHPGRHGTINSYLIYSKLIEDEISFDILPVKIADSAGNINYFDLLCGFQYAANDEDVDIINMSLGWYNHHHTLLGRFITNVESTKLVVTSAGNSGNNNDIIPHYPSSYPSDNILSVTALSYGQLPISEGRLGLADFANIGSVSVDIAARGNNLAFEYGNMTHLISGTSYSAALTSAFAGSFDEGFETAPQWREAVFNGAISDQNLEMIDQSSYIRY